MSTQTIEAFYLGVFADLDPNEGNFLSENSGSLVGTTFGGLGDPLNARIESLTLEDTDNDGAMREDDNRQSGRTPRGDFLIDDLRIGDLVTTIDNGPQRPVWISRQRLGQAALLSAANLRPVLIKHGALGPIRALLVSQQHGMLDPRTGRCLARAKHLVGNLRGTRICHGKRDVTYIHLMFGSYQIIFAEGIGSESFFPGPMALNAVAPPALRELLLLFPDLGKGGALSGAGQAAAYGGTARRFLRKKGGSQHSSDPVERLTRMPRSRAHSPL